MCLWFVCFYVGEHGSSSGLKHLRRRGHGLVSQYRRVEPVIKLGIPGYKASDLSTTPHLLCFACFLLAVVATIFIVDL